jgi:hypothetical protein
MTFCARLRFKILSRLNWDDQSRIQLSLQGIPNASIEMSGVAFPFGHWAVAFSRGHASSERARLAGQRLADALVVLGAIDKLGLDLGFSKPTLNFAASVHDAVRRTTGRELRPETHGLMVYEEDSIQIVGSEARLEVLTDPARFERQLSHWVDMTVALSERQRHCAALLNDSFYVGRTEAQFILRVSAVEALCGQMELSERYISAVDALQEHLTTMHLEDDVLATLEGTLRYAKRQSIRQAYLAKFRALDLANEGRRFDELYGLRSKLVHEGQGRGELQQASDLALELGTRLLSKDLDTAHATA